MKAGRVFEAAIVDALRPFVVPGGTVLNVGANFGQMSLIFSDLVGPDGHVYAFEANDYVCDILRRNVQADGCANATVTQAAVYRESGIELVFPSPDLTRFSSYGAFGLDPLASEGVRMQTLALDDIKIVGSVCLMKIDTQGADLSVLRGARNLIANHQMSIIFELEDQFLDRFDDRASDYFDWADDIGYKI